MNLGRVCISIRIIFHYPLVQEGRDNLTVLFSELKIDTKIVAGQCEIIPLEGGRSCVLELTCVGK